MTAPGSATRSWPRSAGRWATWRTDRSTSWNSSIPSIPLSIRSTSWPRWTTRSRHCGGQPEMYEAIVSVDLGRRHDFTAVLVAEEAVWVGDRPELPAGVYGGPRVQEWAFW